MPYPSTGAACCLSTKTTDVHESVKTFIGRFATESVVRNKYVLEVGSYDVNGSVRPLIESYAPAEYIGTDMREGPGVDVVVDAASLGQRFGIGRFDLVVCAEVLEHVEDWRTAVDNIKRMLKPGGLLLLTTRSKGFPLHEYPGDYWRFEREDMQVIFADMDALEVESDPQAAGVFVVACKPLFASDTPAVDLSTITVRSMQEEPVPAALMTAETILPAPSIKTQWVVVILPVPHAEVFREVAEALHACLVDLGYETLLVTGVPPEGLRAIVFGASAYRDALPADAVLYNMEQVGSQWFTTTLVERYRKHVVWDYSAVNAERFVSLGLSMPVVVPFGYHPCLSRIERKPEAERDIDVLFVGSMNDRRAEILNRLEDEGLRVERLFNVYGEERDAYYARAKVVVNIHFYESAVFEAARVSYCAANGVCVVSERSANYEGSNIAAATVSYAELVEVVTELVVLPDVRADKERLSFLQFQQRPMQRAVQAALAALPLKTSLTLCMIVKNESRVIERCLASVKPFVTSWCVVDTGSTDGTQDLVRAALSDRPGLLLEQPWEREDLNRTAALDAARLLGDYVLWIDADEVFNAEPGVQLPALTADAYNIQVRYGAQVYARTQIVRSEIPWRWVGIVHPFLEGPGSKPAEALPGFFTVPYPDGSSWGDPLKYLKHVVLLEMELDKDPDDARSRYYLAQSYRDAGRPALALQHYLLRASVAGWPEETWSAAYEAAKLMEALKRPTSEVVAAYVDAWRARPSRAEPLHAVARFLNWSGEPAAALMFARQAAVLPQPDDLLFIEHEVYSWRALDELSLAAHHSGRTEEARVAFRRLMQVAPDSEMPRLLRNAQHIDPVD